MRENTRNPFDGVKANDLSDRQIQDYWVDFYGIPGVFGRIKPSSPTPIVIYGGKGSGKTHLMRYLSFPIQRMRLTAEAMSLQAGLVRDQYLGLFVRAGGLNAARFSGKSQSVERWREVFAYHMELWLGRVVLQTFREVLTAETNAVDSERAFVRLALDLFDEAPELDAPTFDNLERALSRLLKECDLAINNAAQGRFDVRITVSRGALIFGLPRAARTVLSYLNDVRFIYLIDELENFGPEHQKYIHTLIREREEPVSFRIGVRLYGMRTHETFGSGEENRAGSEFEVVHLDQEIRSMPLTRLKDIAASLVSKRLEETGFVRVSPGNIAAFFEDPSEKELIDATNQSVLEKDGQRERYWLRHLRDQLRVGVLRRSAPGVDADNIESLLSILQVPDDPFLEKVNVFLFYRKWNEQIDLVAAAEQIRESCLEYSASKKGSQHEKLLRHFRADIVAQMLRDEKQPQRYIGFETYVRMAAGLPRCLLSILSNIYSWALFFGESPFEGIHRISIRAQQEGVDQASDWFFEDARAPGKEGALIRKAMTRIGEVLREIRFSDKPSECSISSFSADITTSTEAAANLLKRAELWSMLVRTEAGQHDRNTGRVDEKYQIHPLLAPRWDLPTVSRGALALSGTETSALFDDAHSAGFVEMKAKRLERMTAPSFGRKAARKAARESARQKRLPGFSDD